MPSNVYDNNGKSRAATATVNPWKMSGSVYRRHYTHLVNHINAAAIRSHCFSQDLITSNENSRLMDMTDRASHNERLLGFLEGGNLDTFIAFREILREHGGINFEACVQDFDTVTGMAVCDSIGRTISPRIINCLTSEGKEAGLSELDQLQQAAHRLLQQPEKCYYTWLKCCTDGSLPKQDDDPWQHPRFLPEFHQWIMRLSADSIRKACIKTGMLQQDQINPLVTTENQKGKAAHNQMLVEYVMPGELKSYLQFLNALSVLGYDDKRGQMEELLPSAFVAFVKEVKDITIQGPSSEMKPFLSATWTASPLQEAPAQQVAMYPDNISLSDGSIGSDDAWLSPDADGVGDVLDGGGTCILETVHGLIFLDKAYCEDEANLTALAGVMEEQGFRVDQFELKFMATKSFQTKSVKIQKTLQRSQSILLSIVVDLNKSDPDYAEVVNTLQQTLSAIVDSDKIEIKSSHPYRSVIMIIRMPVEAALCLYRYAIFVPAFLRGIGIMRLNILGRATWLSTGNGDLGSDQSPTGVLTGITQEPLLLSELVMAFYPPDQRANLARMTLDAVLKDCSSRSFGTPLQMAKLLRLLQDHYQILVPSSSQVSGCTTAQHDEPRSPAPPELPGRSDDLAVDQVSLSSPPSEDQVVEKMQSSPVTTNPSPHDSGLEDSMTPIVPAAQAAATAAMSEDNEMTPPDSNPEHSVAVTHTVQTLKTIGDVADEARFDISSPPKINWRQWLVGNLLIAYLTSTVGSEWTMPSYKPVRPAWDQRRRISVVPP